MSHSASQPHDVSADASRSSTPATMLPAVPAALLLDKRLMPLERNAWMFLCASADEAGRAVGISYTQLRHFLACVPDIELASRETVARTITVLRLTRWIADLSGCNHKGPSSPTGGVKSGVKIQKRKRTYRPKSVSP